MSNYSVASLVEKVRIALDENATTTSLLTGTVETLGLNAIIEQKIAHAARQITERAPSHLLDGGKAFAESLTWPSGTVGSGYAYASLPDDFMRLVVFQMSDWARPVVNAINDNDPRYFLQKSKFSGIKGNTEKPVCAITTHSTGKVMEFYSCSGGSGVTVKTARYLAYPEAKISNEVLVYDLCPKLFDAIIYQTAGLVAMTYKDAISGTLFQIAETFLK